MKNASKLALALAAAAAAAVASTGTGQALACADLRVAPLSDIAYDPLDPAPTVRQITLLFSRSAVCDGAASEDGLGLVEVAFVDAEAGDKTVGACASTSWDAGSAS